MHAQVRTRVTGGFSLDEAARLYRSSSSGARLACPTCGGPMREVVGPKAPAAVWLVRCDHCERNLVFDRPPSPETDRESLDRSRD
jgi:hypothetical protein